MTQPSGALRKVYDRRAVEARRSGRRLSYPIEEIRAHFRWLQEMGASKVYIEQSLAHVASPVAVSQARYAKGRKRVNAALGEAVLALRPPTLDERPGRSLVDATGTRRRLAGLMLEGFSVAEVARRIDRDGPSLQRVLWSRRGVYAETARRVRDFANRPGPAPTGPSVNKTKALARRRGYAPLAAWDDIDNPDERPYGVAV